MNEKPTVRQREVDRQEGRFVVLTLDNPPINAASTRLRADLLAAMVALSGRADIAGVVIHGANGKFVAGADIREFDLPPEPPAITEVIRAIETCPVPVGAAIEGMALGGGYEIALACDARVGTPSALVGLPEVTLGLIPGGGGTQRLPRIVSVAEAIEINVGTSDRATEALPSVCSTQSWTEDLIEGDSSSVRNAGAEEPAHGSSAACQHRGRNCARRAGALRRGRGADAVGVAASAIRNSMVLDSDSALQWERTMSRFVAPRATVEGVAPSLLCRESGPEDRAHRPRWPESALSAAGPWGQALRPPSLPAVFRSFWSSSPELLTRALLRVQGRQGGAPARKDRVR